MTIIILTYSRKVILESLRLLTILLFSSGPVFCSDLILYGGHIYTADAALGEAQAIVIEDNEIIYVGTEREALTYRRPMTRVISTKGKMVLPGFHDAHVHPLLGGRSIMGCDLSGAAELTDLTNILRSCQDNSKKNWLIADGLNLGFFDQSGPTLDWLDNVSETRPMLLRASDGHSVSINSRALELANISRDTSDPPAGLIERDETGAPSGTLRESAMMLAEMHVPAMTELERIEALQLAIAEMNRFGITSIFDAWVGSKDIEAYKAIERQQQLNIRVKAALAYGYGDLFALDPPAKYESLLLDRATLHSDRFDLSAVKLFIDGVLEGETAALVSPYLHQPGYKGELTYSPEQLGNIVTKLEKEGVQIYTHAVGDGGVRAILDAFEFARHSQGLMGLRHHISHLQLIHPDDHDRFSQLGVVANFQALWAQPDEWITNLNLPVVGIDRVQRMYPISSIVRSGGTIVGGSDWNVSSLNPLDAIEVALLRQDWLANDDMEDDELYKLDVLNGRERVDLDNMLHAYTINAAWSMHQEELTGSLSPGKRADIVVLSADLFDIPPQRISTVAVEMTFLDGKLVYKK